MSQVSIADEAAEKLRGLLSRMGVGGEVEAREDDARVTLIVKNVDSGLIIGRQGSTLDALQYLVNKMVAQSHGGVERKPISVDTEGYRERRAESLVELAHRLAEKAVKTGRPVAVHPMSAGDRRVMHMALADVAGVTTRSEGEGAHRRLVVVPDPDKVAGAKPVASDEPHE
jgi:spoIIIJ-associated protein